MRYCPECLTIYETEGNVCGTCNEPTVEIDVIRDNQTPLFPPSEEDKVRSVYDSLKQAYRDAMDGVFKAEKKLREAQAELARAGAVLLDYDSVIKGKTVKGLPAHEEEPKPEKPEKPKRSKPKLKSKVVSLKQDDDDIELVGAGVEAAES